MIVTDTVDTTMWRDASSNIMFSLAKEKLCCMYSTSLVLAQPYLLVARSATIGGCATILLAVAKLTDATIFPTCDLYLVHF